jgi:flavin-dependent dehydrogenase
MDFDVIIVGGGPAGISTALFLAAAAPHLRERFVVLERGVYPREKICAGAVGARADRLLESIGVTVDVPSVPISGFSVAAQTGTLSCRLDGQVIGRVVRRVEFDHALAERARARGIRVLDGVEVTGLSMMHDGVRIETETGPVSGRAVVGADGVGSIVRRSLGFPRGDLVAQAVEVDTDTAPGDPGRDVLHFDLGEDDFAGYAWDFPTLVDGVPLICRGVYELGIDDRKGAVDVSERLRRRIDRMGLRAPTKLKRFAERGFSLAGPMARPRALLVGEAAGIDPVLGEGIAQAIQYGAVAGPYIARCLARRDLSFTDWASVVRRSRVGVDLVLRSSMARRVHGSTRKVVERLVTSSNALAIAGMHYFAGNHVPRMKIAAALGGLGRAAMVEAFTSARAGRGPWS